MVRSVEVADPVEESMRGRYPTFGLGRTVAGQCGRRSGLIDRDGVVLTSRQHGQVGEVVFAVGVVVCSPTGLPLTSVTGPPFGPVIFKHDAGDAGLARVLQAVAVACRPRRSRRPTLTAGCSC